MLSALSLLLALPSGAPPLEARSLTPRRVTAAYLRMHDAEFVSRAFAESSDPRGRRLARALLPADVLAGRLPERGRGVPSYGDIAGKGTKPTVEIDFGSIVQKSQPLTSPYRIVYGTASRTGRLRIDGPSDKAGPYLESIRVFDGTHGPNGEAGTAYQQGDDIPIKGGQDYQLNFVLDQSKVGDYARTFVANDGRKGVINARGKVIAQVGTLACWIEKGDFRLTGNASAVGTIRAVVETNKQTPVRTTATCSLAKVKITADVPTVGEFKGTTKREISIPYRVEVPRNIEDGEGTISFKVTILDGKEAVDLKTSIKVQTIWTVLEGPDLVEGTVRARPRLRYSDAGEWWLDVHTWSTKKDPASPLFALAFAPPPSGASPPGFQLEGPLAESTAYKAQAVDGNVSYSFVRYWSYYGQDDRLRTVVPGTAVATLLLVGKPGALASASPAWASWRTAHPFTPFPKPVNAWTL